MIVVLDLNSGLEVWIEKGNPEEDPDRDLDADCNGDFEDLLWECSVGIFCGILD